MIPEKKALYLKDKMPLEAMTLIKRMIKQYTERKISRGRLFYWNEVRNEYWKLIGIKYSKKLSYMKKGPNVIIP